MIASTAQSNPPCHELAKSAPIHIGVDVAKKTLALAFAGLKPEYPNTPKGHAAIIRALPAAAHVVMEATGGYQCAFVRCLHAHNIAVSVLNARQVRDFAKSMGQLAKSDAIDAAVNNWWSFAILKATALSTTAMPKSQKTQRSSWLPSRSKSRSSKRWPRPSLPLMRALNPRPSG